MRLVIIVSGQSPFSSPGDVTAQLTAAPTCLGDTFTFSCTVTGDRSGISSWRVNRTYDCVLVHRARGSPSMCGVNGAYTSRPGTGFGSSGDKFTSTLSGTAITELFIECFGPANNLDPGNRVGNITFQILGQYVFAHPD